MAKPMVSARLREEGSVQHNPEVHCPNPKCAFGFGKRTLKASDLFGRTNWHFAPYQIVFCKKCMVAVGPY